MVYVLSKCRPESRCPAQRAAVFRVERERAGAAIARCRPSARDARGARRQRRGRRGIAADSADRPRQGDQFRRGGARDHPRLARPRRILWRDGPDRRQPAFGERGRGRAVRTADHRQERVPALHAGELPGRRRSSCRSWCAACARPTARSRAWRCSTSMAASPALLLDMSEEENGKRLVRKKLSKQDMAHMIGASREMVSKVMRDLEVGGYIISSGDTIIITGTYGVGVTGSQPRNAEPVAGEDRQPSAGIALAGTRGGRPVPVDGAVGFPQGRSGLVARGRFGNPAQSDRPCRRLACRPDALPVRLFGLVVDRLAGAVRLVGLPPPRRACATADRRPLYIALAGFVLLLVASIGARGAALSHAQGGAAAGARRHARHRGRAACSRHLLGYTGSTLLLLAAMAAGWSIFSGHVVAVGVRAPRRAARGGCRRFATD